MAKKKFYYQFHYENKKIEFFLSQSHKLKNRLLIKKANKEILMKDKGLN